jgi:DNA-binding winged helix-turn-helix (wHTH) protein
VRLRFSEFVLDADRRQLFRRGEELRLGPKAYELLDLLIRSNPRAVAKSQIRRRLWPDVSVGAGTLGVLMTELRAALGDDAKEPRFIRTVRGFGYAFCGAAEEEGAGRHAAAGTTACRLEWDKREIPLREGENILGRTDDAVAWIDSPRVSRRHARIIVSGGTATIEDLGSKNGTSVSGRRIDRPTLLAAGDEIALGPVLMTFRAFRATGSTDTER